MEVPQSVSAFSDTYVEVPKSVRAFSDTYVEVPKSVCGSLSHMWKGPARGESQGGAPSAGSLLSRYRWSNYF